MGIRPSIRDVAARAGVSTALASYALNDRPGVSAESKSRILAVARELGYRADPFGQGLRKGAANSFGVIVRNLQNPFFVDVLDGAQQAASERGATILAVNSDYSSDREREHIEHLIAQRVLGLAIAPVGDAKEVRRWTELYPRHPTVILNAVRPEGCPGVEVSPDNVRAVDLAVDHLAGLGHRRITFLTAPAELMADRDRLDAFEARCAVVGISAEPLQTPLSLEAVYEETLSALRTERRPTAVVTNSDFTAHAVYRAARAAGLEVGRDLSIVGHDDLPTSELLDPPLTTLRVNRRAIGRAVFDRLIGGSAARPVQLGDHREPVGLVVRASTGPPVR